MTRTRNKKVFYFGPRGPGYHERYSMTPAMQKMYLEIIEYTDKNRVSPTVRELAVLTGLSEMSVALIHKRLRDLKERGWITIDTSRPNIIGRGITLTKPIIRFTPTTEAA